jgi:predicted Zn-dependent protease
MMKRTGLLGVIVLALLAACSKTSPPDKTSVAEAAKAASTAAAVTDSEQEAPPPPTAPQADTAPPAPAIDPAQKAAGLLALIDTAPQCQTFRTQLETAGKSPTSTGAELNAIVAKAGEAGCTKKPGTP